MQRLIARGVARLVFSNPVRLGWRLSQLCFKRLTPFFWPFRFVIASRQLRNFLSVTLLFFSQVRQAMKSKVLRRCTVYYFDVCHSIKIYFRSWTKAVSNFVYTRYPSAISAAERNCEAASRVAATLFQILLFICSFEEWTYLCIIIVAIHFVMPSVVGRVFVEALGYFAGGLHPMIILIYQHNPWLAFIAGCVLGKAIVIGCSVGLLSVISMRADWCSICLDQYDWLGIVATAYYSCQKCSFGQASEFNETGLNSREARTQDNYTTQENNLQHQEPLNTHHPQERNNTIPDQESLSATPSIADDDDNANQELPVLRTSTSGTLSGTGDTATSTVPETASAEPRAKAENCAEGNEGPDNCHHEEEPQLFAQDDHESAEREVPTLIHDAAFVAGLPAHEPLRFPVGTQDSSELVRLDGNDARGSSSLSNAGHSSGNGDTNSGRGSGRSNDPTTAGGNHVGNLTYNSTTPSGSTRGTAPSGSTEQSDDTTVPAQSSNASSAPPVRRLRVKKPSFEAAFPHAGRAFFSVSTWDCVVYGLVNMLIASSVVAILMAWVVAKLGLALTPAIAVFHVPNADYGMDFSFSSQVLRALYSLMVHLRDGVVPESLRTSVEAPVAVTTSVSWKVSAATCSAAVFVAYIFWSAGVLLKGVEAPDKNVVKFLEFLCNKHQVVEWLVRGSGSWQNFLQFRASGGTNIIRNITHRRPGSNSPHRNSRGGLLLRLYIWISRSYGDVAIPDGWEINEVAIRVWPRMRRIYLSAEDVAGVEYGSGIRLVRSGSLDCRDFKVAGVFVARFPNGADVQFQVWLPKDCVPNHDTGYVRFAASRIFTLFEGSPIPHTARGFYLTEESDHRFTFRYTIAKAPREVDASSPQRHSNRASAGRTNANCHQRDDLVTATSTGLSAYSILTKIHKTVRGAVLHLLPVRVMMWTAAVLGASVGAGLATSFLLVLPLYLGGLVLRRLNLDPTPLAFETIWPVEENLSDTSGVPALSRINSLLPTSINLETIHRSTYLTGEITAWQVWAIGLFALISLLQTASVVLRVIRTEYRVASTRPTESSSSIARLPSLLGTLNNIVRSLFRHLLYKCLRLAVHVTTPILYGYLFDKYVLYGGERFALLKWFLIGFPPHYLRWTIIAFLDMSVYFHPLLLLNSFSPTLRYFRAYGIFLMASDPEVLDREVISDASRYVLWYVLEQVAIVSPLILIESLTPISAQTFIGTVTTIYAMYHAQRWLREFHNAAWKKKYVKERELLRFTEIGNSVVGLSGS